MAPLSTPTERLKHSSDSSYSINMNASKADEISTPFGKGTLNEYRDHDETIVIDLPFATLYTARQSLEEWNRIDSNPDQVFPWNQLEAEIEVEVEPEIEVEVEAEPEIEVEVEVEAEAEAEPKQEPKQKQEPEIEIEVEVETSASEVDDVSTPFGKGTFTQYRNDDETIVIALSFATLYATRQSLEEWNHIESDPDQTFPWPKSVIKKRGTMELNHAYESFETMRKLHLELKCAEIGIYEINYEQCTTCLLNSPPTPPPPPPTPTPPPPPPTPAKAASGGMFGNGRFPRIKKLVDHGQKQKPFEFPRIQKLVTEQRKRNLTSKATRCLICATPCCAAHSSKTFRQESLTVCTDCEEVFQLDFVVDCLTDRDKLPEHVERMVDLYDRAVLLLKYSSQHIPDIATQLEGTQERQNRVGLGSSSAGVVSGILGIAAAATIITPAGPPLLIASLLFGGSATAISTGTEARNYYSEPNQVASRIQALHGMVNAILRVTGTLRDAILRDHIRTDDYENKDGCTELSSSTAARDMAITALAQHKAKVMAAATAGRFSAAGMETAASVGTTSRILSRTGSNLMKTVRVARFAGGALSAAVLVFEAKSLHDTIQDIRTGNPCEKAESLRKVQAELATLPTTEHVDQECQSYIDAMKHRERAMTEETVIQLLMEHTGGAVAPSTIVEEELGLEILPAAEPLDEREEPTFSDSVSQPQAAAASVPVAEDSSMSASLLERIQIHKEKDAMSASLMERIQYHKQNEQSGEGDSLP
jgi:hypothetical protein